MTSQEMFNLTPFDSVYVIHEGYGHKFKYGEKINRVKGGGRYDCEVSCCFENESGFRNYIMHHDISFTNPLIYKND